MAPGPAAMAGGVLVFEAMDGSLAALDLASGHREAVTVGPALLPVRRTSSATGGAETPAGSLLLAPGGRLGRPSDGRRLDAATHAIEGLGEVVP